jgi:hypothetical protein
MSKNNPTCILCPDDPEDCHGCCPANGNWFGSYEDDVKMARVGYRIIQVAPDRKP